MSIGPIQSALSPEPAFSLTCGMLQKIRWVMAAQLLLLGLLWMGLPLEMQAGDKLRKLKEDVQRVQHGTLLIAPILPDSFVLRKYDRPEDAAKRTAYLESL